MSKDEFLEQIRNGEAEVLVDFLEGECGLDLDNVIKKQFDFVGEKETERLINTYGIIED